MDMIPPYKNKKNNATWCFVVLTKNIISSNQYMQMMLTSPPPYVNTITYFIIFV